MATKVVFLFFWVANEWDDTWELSQEDHRTILQQLNYENDLGSDSRLSTESNGVEGVLPAEILESNGSDDSEDDWGNVLSSKAGRRPTSPTLL